MTSEMTERLRRAQTSDPRALDRICEQAAAELIDTDTEPNYPVTTADFTTDALLICADRYWRRRFLAEPTVDTAVHCALWIAGYVVPEHRQVIEEKWALGYAFITRDTVDVDTALEAVTCQIEDLGERAVDSAYFACVYQAGKLRANFDFDSLYRLTSWSRLAETAGLRRTEPAFVALRAFAAFGSRTYTPEHSLDLMSQAWAHPRRSRAAIDICLNGLAIAPPFTAQGPILREHATAALTEYPNDHAFHYWLAIGHEICGDYVAAGEAIDDALRLLPAHSSRGSHTLLLEQYRQRRATIHDGQRLTQRHEQAEGRPAEHLPAGSAQQPSQPSSQPLSCAATGTLTVPKLLALFTPIAMLMLLVVQLVPRPAANAGLSERAVAIGILAAALTGTCVAVVICTRIYSAVRRR